MARVLDRSAPFAGSGGNGACQTSPSIVEVGEFGFGCLLITNWGLLQKKVSTLIPLFSKEKALHNSKWWQCK